MQVILNAFAPGYLRILTADYIGRLRNLYYDIKRTLWRRRQIQ